MAQNEKAVGPSASGITARELPVDKESEKESEKHVW
jgi:hypothetical protein